MNILFVCVHNAGRSQMAEAYFRAFAKAAGQDVATESAGTLGAGTLNPLVVQVMGEDGISLAGHHPKLLTQEMVDRADKVISMGCGVDAEVCPAKFILTEDWGLDDPAGQPIEKVRAIRDEIKRKVQDLLGQVPI